MCFPFSCSVWYVVMCGHILLVRWKLEHIFSLSTKSLAGLETLKPLSHLYIAAPQPVKKWPGLALDLCFGMGQVSKIFWCDTIDLPPPLRVQTQVGCLATASDNHWAISLFAPMPSLHTIFNSLRPHLKQLQLLILLDFTPDSHVKWFCNWKWFFIINF
jgi:hypothetical protein